MSVRLSAVVLGLAALLATAAFTYAADQKLGATPQPLPTVAAKPATLVVPDVQSKAYVFAKGMLQDAGFAWRVKGGVRGFAANVVATQTPAPGTRILDNGAPTIVLTLARNGKYGQTGAPEDAAPYAGTSVQLADLASARTALPNTSKTVAKAPRAKPAKPKAAMHRPAAKPKRAAAKKAAPKYPQHRPPAFAVAGAPKEPLDEMPLPDRVKVLGRWLGAHPKPTNSNVSHWLFQNEWIVQGAKFGWWRGAEALKLLIAADRRAENLWGIGTKSAAAAEATLAEVEARTS